MLVLARFLLSELYSYISREYRATVDCTYFRECIDYRLKVLWSENLITYGGKRPLTRYRTHMHPLTSYRALRRPLASYCALMPTITPNRAVASSVLTNRTI